MHYSLNSMPYSPDSGRTCLTRVMFCSRRLRREEWHGGQGSPSCTVGTVVGKLAVGLEEDGGGDPGAELMRWDWERGTLSAGGRRPVRVWGKTGGRLARMDRIPATSMIDEGMTPRVLMFSIPAFGYGRSLLEGYVKPARPNTPTSSRSQETPCKP
jgi:hypothetical protein